MRQISNESIECFLTANSYNKNNTCVIVLPNVTILQLYATKIAYKYNDPNKTIAITTGGFNTNCTIERLNAIPNVKIKRVKGVMYLNGSIWDGELIDIN